MRKRRNAARGEAGRRGAVCRQCDGRRGGARGIGPTWRGRRSGWRGEQPPPLAVARGEGRPCSARRRDSPCERHSRQKPRCPPEVQGGGRGHEASGSSGRRCRMDGTWLGGHVAWWACRPHAGATAVAAGGYLLGRIDRRRLGRLVGAPACLEVVQRAAVEDSLNGAVATARRRVSRLIPALVLGIRVAPRLQQKTHYAAPRVRRRRVQRRRPTMVATADLAALAAQQPLDCLRLAVGRRPVQRGVTQQRLGRFFRAVAQQPLVLGEQPLKCCHLPVRVRVRAALRARARVRLHSVAFGCILGSVLGLGEGLGEGFGGEGFDDGGLGGCIGLSCC